MILGNWEEKGATGKCCLFFSVQAGEQFALSNSSVIEKFYNQAKGLAGITIAFSFSKIT